MPEKKEKQVLTVTLKKRIIAEHPHYRKTPYMYAVPMSIHTNAPKTGQDLPLDKMTGKVALTKEDRNSLQMGENPYLINPTETHPLIHGRTFDLSYKYEVDADGNESRREYLNPRDHAEFDMFTVDINDGSAESPIAPSKKEFRKQRHYFYIEDKEKEAGEDIDIMEKSFEAEKFVREDIGSGRWKDIILLLNFEIPGYNINPDVMSDTQIKANVLKACKEHPEAVLKLKGDGSNQTVFAIKLIRNKIIYKKNGTDFYYGDLYIGTTIDSITSFIGNPKNADTTTKWQQLVDKRGK